MTHTIDAGRRFRECVRGRGLISPAELESATLTASERGTSLEETLVALGLLTEDQVGALVADELGLSYVFPDSRAIDPDLVRLFPAALLVRHHAIPLLPEGDRVVLAAAEPLDDAARRALESASGRPVTIALASRRRIDAILAQLSGVPAAPPQDPGAVALLYTNLAKALVANASEVRFEPDGDDIVVRHRLAGRLVGQGRAPSTLLLPLLSRVRMLGSGRVVTRIGARRVALEIAELSTRAGAAVLIRFIRETGLDPDAERAVLLDHGFIRVPDRGTGYALLRKADPAGRCIVAIDSEAADAADIRQVDAGPFALRFALDYRPDVLFVAVVHEIDLPALIAASARRVVVAVTDAPAEAR